MIRKNFHLTTEQNESLEQIAKQDGITVAEHIRMAISDYIEKKATKTSSESPSLRTGIFYRGRV
jgi:hypothetical protein